MTIKEIIEIIAGLVGIALTIAIIHFTFTNRKKTKADNIKLLWERIDALDAKNIAMGKRLDEEINKRDGIIERLLSKIERLETRLREYGIPLPQDDDETRPLKITKGLAMKK